MQQKLPRRLLPPTPIVGIATQVYQLLLYLYPATFRAEYGEPMVQLFRDKNRAVLHTGRPLLLIRLWLFALVDLLSTACAEHLSELFHGSSYWGGPTMNYLEKLRDFAVDPEQLELTYQGAVKAGEREAFAEALQLARREDSKNLLFAAWHYRLLHAARRVIAWGWAVPLALLNGLLLWWFSDETRYTLPVVNPFAGAQAQATTSGVTIFGSEQPAILIFGSGLAAVFIIAFLAGAGTRRWGRLLAIALALAVPISYVMLLYGRMGTIVYQEQYLALAAIHLALLAWAGIALYVLSGHWDARNRFAFLVKSLEFLITGGLFGFILLLFAGVTFGLFSALDIELPATIMRLFFVGGGGMIGVLAVALVIEPKAAPAQQPFDEGLSRLITLLLRLLLPLAVVVLTVFIGFIPANVREPFENRDVLIAFNAMLFAVIALLVGVTPLARSDLNERLWGWLWRGIVALAALALLIGVYALAAILYRTLEDRLTPNRLAFIGWNVINLGVLLWLLVLQARTAPADRVRALHRTLTGAMIPYALWALFTVLAIPWLFPINQGVVANLPPDIQRLVGQEPYPILLKCVSSPHIYALDEGQKRWIKDIPTFEAEGFNWRDVHFESCDELDAIPNGPPIPPDAGSPPAVP